MHDALITHAAMRGIEFMSTAFDEESVEAVSSLAKVRGATAGYLAAEAFELLRARYS
jgi:sialic acid synthase SpsE